MIPRRTSGVARCRVFTTPPNGTGPDVSDFVCDCCGITSGWTFTDMRAKIDKPPGDLPSNTWFCELSSPTNRVSSSCDVPSSAKRAIFIPPTPPEFPPPEFPPELLLSEFPPELSDLAASNECVPSAFENSITGVDEENHPYPATPGTMLVIISIANFFQECC